MKLFFFLFVALAQAWAMQSHFVLKNGEVSCAPYECAPGVLPEGKQSLDTLGGNPVLRTLSSSGNLLTSWFTNDFETLPGYSGKELEILVTLDSTGTIRQARLIYHHEPIILAGIPEKKIHDYLTQYDNLALNRISTWQPVLDAVSGATVTALVADDVVRGSVKKIAKYTGLIDATQRGEGFILQEAPPMDWNSLLEEKLLNHFQGSVDENDILPSQRGTGSFLDMYYGLLNVPALGKNLVGDEVLAVLKDRLGDVPFLIVLNRGSYSFKGSGFVRGGLFDRLNLKQGQLSLRFRDTDYFYTFQLKAVGAPEFREMAVFAIRDKSFSMVDPWDLSVLVSLRTSKSALGKTFDILSTHFVLNPDYIVGSEKNTSSGMTRLWELKKGWIVLYVILWFVVLLAFAFRRKTAKNARFLEAFHLSILLLSILLLGVAQKGQPSVVNIFTFVDVIRNGGGLSFFLSEPFIFVSWIAITISGLLWGRGPFCGWICPYGAVMEWSFTLRKWLTPWKKSAELPDKIHRKLVNLPYMILVSLLTLSLFSLQLAEIAAEIEPFKTTWLVGVFNRPLFLTIYWIWLLLMGFFTVRFFCRYICPLGAWLAVLGRFQIFRIPRRNFCTRCSLCAKGCSTRAIDKEGAIDSSTCFGCLECITRHDDAKICPPLLNRKIFDKYEKGQKS